MCICMKKNVITYMVLAVLTACFSPVSAQVSHFVGPYIQGGEYSIFTKADTTLKQTPSLGGGGSFGVVYELRAGKHFLLDAGVAGNAGWTQFNLPDKTFSREESYQLITDAYLSSSLQIPVLVGGQWGRFYFLGGVKLDLEMYKQDSLRAMHVMYDVPVEYGKFKKTLQPELNPNLFVSAELGFRLGDVFEATGYDVPKQPVQYRLGLFADLGVLKTPIKGTEKYVYGDFMNSEEAFIAQARFLPFMVGVKFQVLFQLPQSKGCIICKEHSLRSNYGIIE